MDKRHEQSLYFLTRPAGYPQEFSTRLLARKDCDIGLCYADCLGKKFDAGFVGFTLHGQCVKFQNQFSRWPDPQAVASRPRLDTQPERQRVALDLKLAHHQ